MNAGLVAMMVTLVGVAVVHTRSRIGGALATIGWGAAALFFGAWEFSTRENGVVFLGIQTPKWVFYVAICGVIAWNISIVVRAFTRRTATPPAKTTTTKPD